MTLARPLAGLLLLSAALPSRGADRLAELRRQAQPIDSLGSFVERYVGLCKDRIERAACEQNVKAVRKKVDGKLYATVLSERVDTLLKVRRHGDGFRFLVTPIVDADGMALTNGAPRLDSRGRLSIGLLLLDSEASVDEGLVEASMRTGRIELEILFRPEGAWKLPHRGDREGWRGMRARFVALRIVDGRTGTELAARIFGAAPRGGGRPPAGR